MEQEKKHRFRVINDRERIVTAEIEVRENKLLHMPDNANLKQKQNYAI